MKRLMPAIVIASAPVAGAAVVVTVLLAGSSGAAIGVPGLAALNKNGLASVSSVSCAPAGTCAVGGEYIDGQRHGQGFVVSQTGQSG
jgi:hypothetical protein